MNTLHETIKQMITDEVKIYKIYASRSSLNNENRKDLTLFDLYRKQDEPNDNHISQKIYGKQPDSTYSRLKNRLYQDLSKSFILNGFDDKNIDGLLKFALYKYHYDKNRYSLALRMLRQAQKRATEQNDYELLDMILSALVKLSREFPDIDPEVIVQQRVLNEKKLRLSKQADDLLALLTHRLRLNQSMEKNPGDDAAREALKIIREFKRNPAYHEERSLALRMHKTVCRYFIEKKNFESLTSYLLENIEEISPYSLNKQEVETSAELIIYLINALNETRRFDLVPQYTSLLSSLLEKSGKLMWKKFSYFCYQPLVYMHSEKRMHEKALHILEEMIRLKISGFNPTYELFTLLNMAICKYELRRYKEAAKHIAIMRRNKAYPKLEKRFRLKIELADFIIRFSGEDFSYIEIRLPQISKDFKQELSDAEKTLIQLFQQMLKSPNYRTDKKAIELALKITENPSTDRYAIDHVFWVKSHFDKTR